MALVSSPIDDLFSSISMDGVMLSDCQMSSLRSSLNCPQHVNIPYENTLHVCSVLVTTLLASYLVPIQLLHPPASTSHLDPYSILVRLFIIYDR